MHWHIDSLNAPTNNNKTNKLEKEQATGRHGFSATYGALRGDNATGAPQSVCFRPSLVGQSHQPQHWRGRGIGYCFTIQLHALCCIEESEPVKSGAKQGTKRRKMTYWMIQMGLGDTTSTSLDGELHVGMDE